MILAVAVVFLNEETLLPVLLESISRQTRLPDRLLLVDDGSTDASPEIARRFASEHAYAKLVRRPSRGREADRLAAAAELQAFQWAVAGHDERYDILAKLDGDLELAPRFFEQIVAALEIDPSLGIAGAELNVLGGDGEPEPERSAPWHVRGATKFYRRECWQQISPLPEILGWDTIDEARARMAGWQVAVIPMETTSLHLRATGSYDGALRGFRRRGAAAWGYGAHPLSVLIGAAVRMPDRPRVRGGLAYLRGWVEAALRRRPRAEPELVRFVQGEQLRRVRRALTHGQGA
jgi:poly-beta-1,6-N-acetyl-D-glucosamine synthase